MENPTTAPALTGPHALLQQSINFYREHLGKIAGIFLLPVLISLLVIFVSTSTLSPSTPALDAPGQVVSVFLASLVSALVMALASLTFFVFLASDGALTVGGSFRQIWHWILPLIWVSILFNLVLFGAAVLFIIPALIFSVWLSQVYFVTVAENKRGLFSLLTSWHRSSGYWWSIVLRWLYAGVIYLAVFLVLSLIVKLLSPLGELAEFLFQLVNLLVLGPILTIYSYLIYRDLRRIKGEPDPLAPNNQSKRRWLIGLAILGLAVPIIFLLVAGWGLLTILQNSILPYYQLPAGLGFLPFPLASWFSW